MRKSVQLKNEIASNPCCSYWLKQAVQDLDARDICDVLDDLERLSDLYKRQWRELQDDFKAMREVS